MSVPFAVTTEINAQTVLIFNTLYDVIIKNKLGKSLNILKGLYFGGKDSPPFLKIGIVLILRTSGKVPSSNDLFIS